MKTDVHKARSVRIMPGGVAIAAIEFKSELARLRWELEWPRGFVLSLPGGIPASAGRSIYLLSHDGKPAAWAAHRLFLPILERRIREAGAIEAQRGGK
jgi:hypothetical protein